MTRRVRMDDEDDSNGEGNGGNNGPHPKTQHHHRYRHPSESAHWKSLNHQPGDRQWETASDMLASFQKDIQKDNNNTNVVHGRTVALWSCVCGYLEALATHKDPLQRYALFPVPFQALKRLVEEEFQPMITDVLKEEEEQQQDDSKNQTKHISSDTIDHYRHNHHHHHHHHRRRVRAIANRIWTKAKAKPNVRDELHANSLYVCLRGSIDGKSLDCFGAALVTIVACQQMQEQEQINNNKTKNHIQSRLALSEDHAYERHFYWGGWETDHNEDSSPSNNNSSNIHTTLQHTCEVAIPGTTLAAQSKRGKSLAEIFQEKQSSSPSNNNKTTTTKTTTLTPANSWLYMAHHPVICQSTGMTLVALVGNINCTILKNMPNHKRRGIITSLASGPLYDLKRDLLWLLYEQGHMNHFPFGLLELGDCEEHRESGKSKGWVQVADIDEPILKNEHLFWQAIQINREQYNDSQTYPYFYAGHYHKDAGNEGPEHEYRLVYAVQHYALAARVASRYYYQGLDSLALNQHFSGVALLMAEDIWTPKYDDGTAITVNTTTKKEKKEARQWVQEENAIAAATWMIGFMDALLCWEEASGSKSFVETLNPSHKHFVGKLWQLLPLEIRRKSLGRVLMPDPKNHEANSSTIVMVPPANEISSSSQTGRNLPHFVSPQSKRMSRGTLLLKALEKPKVVIREMELAIPMEASGDDDTGGRRSSKRSRRS